MLYGTQQCLQGSSDASRDLMMLSIPGGALNICLAFPLVFLYIYKFTAYIVYEYERLGTDRACTVQSANHVPRIFTVCFCQLRYKPLTLVLSC